MHKKIRKPLLITALVVMLLLLTVSIASASGGNYHKVSYGETLYSIGRYYGVSPYQIADANDIYNPDYIYYGQVLYIPEGHYYYDDYGHNDNKYNHYDDYYTDYHVVGYGETLSSIAYAYGVSPWAIAKANHIYNLDYIYAGQYLYIPSSYDYY